MREDRHRWNKKYAARDFSDLPSPVVERFIHMAPRGRALDIASGPGKNARFLAAKGFEVDAIDISDVALQNLARVDSRIHPICADLDVFDIPASRYSLIVNVRFLSRRLFPLIPEGLIPGGILIFDSYLAGPDRPVGGGFCPDYLLRENELLRAFLSLRIVFYEERSERVEDSARPDRSASLVAIRPR